MKTYMACLRLEPGAAEWKAQTNPQSYGGTQAVHYYLITFGFVPSFEALTHQMQSINYNVQFV